MIMMISRLSTRSWYGRCLYRIPWRTTRHAHQQIQTDQPVISEPLTCSIHQQSLYYSPGESEGDHSTIGIDFNFGALTSHGDLSDVDPVHTENQTLVSTDVKASTAFIKLTKKKNTSHNATARRHKLFKCCDWTGCCTDENWWQNQDLSNMLYTHVKQAKKECKKVSPHAWSCMLAAAGQVVQYASEEFWRWKNHELIKPGKSMSPHL
jgi:hypothetical protein